MTKAQATVYRIYLQFSHSRYAQGRGTTRLQTIASGPVRVLGSHKLSLKQNIFFIGHLHTISMPTLNLQGNNLSRSEQ